MAVSGEITDIELAERLREEGHRATPQRLILHRALREIGRHATAEEVLQAASARLPNLSLPTVYATLELFEELGIARRVSVGGDPVLYDPRADEHAHFACRVCGAVVDLDTPARATAALRAARSAGLEPEAADLVLTGLCDACRSRSRPARSRRRAAAR